MSEQKRRGRPPIGGISQKAKAKAMRLSVRGMQRANFIARYGITDLVEMVQRGELGLGPAEDIARLPIEWQKTVVADGVETVRRMAAQVRIKKTDPYLAVVEIWKRATPAERVEIAELIRRLADKEADAQHEKAVQQIIRGESPTLDG